MIAQGRRHETIAIVGTGNVGGTLGKRWAAAGHTVIYGSRTPNDKRVALLVRESGREASVALPRDAAARADILIVSVPFGAAKEVVPGLGDLTGKVLIDPINYIRILDRYPAPTDLTMSVGEHVQSWAPTAKVVKAFNTVNFNIMADRQRASAPVTVMLCGDDSDAKERVACLVQDIDLQPMDMGPLSSARYVEDMYRLYSGYRRTHPGRAFDFHLAPREDIPQR